MLGAMPVRWPPFFHGALATWNLVVAPRESPSIRPFKDQQTRPSLCCLKLAASPASAPGPQVRVLRVAKLAFL